MIICLILNFTFLDYVGDVIMNYEDKENRDDFEKKNSTALLVIDRNGIVKNINDSAEEFFKNIIRLHKDDIIGQTLTQIVPCIEEAEEICPDISKLEIEGDDYHFIYFNFNKVSDDNIGVVIVKLKIESEIVADLIKEKELRKDCEEILEGSFDGILVTDENGKIQYVNDSYERIAEIKKSEMKGKYMRDLVNPIWMPDSVAHVVARENTTISKKQIVKSGRHIMVTGRPIYNKKNELKRIIINARDITEIYSLTEELQKARKNEKLYISRLEDTIHDDIDLNMKILTASDEMKNVMNLAEKVTNFSTTVLLLGESGTGKEVIARHIHGKSIRKDNPFVVVNCGAIPDTLLESELFGYERGAFTGAINSGKQGLFEITDNGTIFLDEIGEMPLNLQVKILTFLESKEVRRIGSTDSKTVDVRVIAATNRDLGKMVEEGTFREDLYYRLNVVQIDIPPLRKRIDDIMPLSILFLNIFNKKYSQEKVLTYETLKEIERYAWPGNVRQLKNVVENMVIVSNNEYLEPEDLPWYRNGRKNEIVRKIESISENEEISLNDAVEELEKNMLYRAQVLYGSTRKMAEHLGVNQSTIVRKMQKYDMEFKI